MKRDQVYYLAKQITWDQTGDVYIPYQAQVDDQIWFLRLNDFPEEPLYTLMIDEAEILDVDDLPPGWRGRR